MAKRRYKMGIAFSVVILITFIFATMSFAGGGFKEKFQQKISQSNINFQGQTDGKDENRVLDYETESQGEYSPAEKPARPVNEPQDRNDRYNYGLAANIKGPGQAREMDAISPMVSSYAIYQTNYQAELEESVVTVKGEATLEVFSKGWAKLPLASSNVGLINVSVSKGTAFVTAQGGKYYLMFDKPGRYKLNFEFLIKAERERENGPGKFAFDIIPAPISQFEFTMPETGVEIFVEPAIKVEVNKEKDKTIAWAVMPNTTSIATRWTKALPKEEITPVALEPKVYVSNETYASIGEGIVRCSSRLNYSILQSEVSNFRLSLPLDASILDVNGKDLRDWKVSKDKDVQYLDVYLSFGVKGNYVLEVNYERSVGQGSVVAAMPALKALGVERESGFFGVAASTNVELAVSKLAGLTSVDVKELPQTMWNRSTSPILLAMKYLNHPFEIAIDVTRHQEIPVLIAAVDEADYVTLYTEEGKVLTKATYQVRNNVKQYLRFILPKGATLWSAFVAGQPVKPAKDNNGSILVPLEKSQLQGESLTQFPVEIVYLDQASTMKMMGQLKIDLPATDIPVSAMYWTVYCPDDYTYFNFGGNVKKTERGFRPLSVVGGSVQRRVGDRLEKKSMQLGQQFDVSQYASQVVPTQQVLESWSVDAVKGKLPIKIDVPQQGSSLRFSKLLVTEQESPWVSIRYTSVLHKLSVPFRWLVAVILIVFIGGRIIKRKKHKT